MPYRRSIPKKQPKTTHQEDLKKLSRDLLQAHRDLKMQMEIMVRDLQKCVALTRRPYVI